MPARASQLGVFGASDRTSRHTEEIIDSSIIQHLSDLHNSRYIVLEFKLHLLYTVNDAYTKCLGMHQSKTYTKDSSRNKLTVKILFCTYRLISNISSFSRKSSIIQHLSDFHTSRYIILELKFHLLHTVNDAYTRCLSMHRSKTYPKDSYRNRFAVKI